MARGDVTGPDSGHAYLPASKTVVIHFSDGCIDFGGELRRPDAQGQLQPVSADDPAFIAHATWKQECERRFEEEKAAKHAATQKMNRAARRAAARKKARRNTGKGGKRRR